MRKNVNTIPHINAKKKVESGGFSVKSASEGECLIAKRIVYSANGLKVKTWWVVEAELDSEKVTAMFSV